MYDKIHYKLKKKKIPVKRKKKKLMRKKKEFVYFFEVVHFIGI